MYIRKSIDDKVVKEKSSAIENVMMNVIDCYQNMTPWM